jgi:hypothetical protein
MQEGISPHDTDGNNWRAGDTNFMAHLWTNYGQHAQQVTTKQYFLYC